MKPIAVTPPGGRLRRRHEVPPSDVSNRWWFPVQFSCAYVTARSLSKKAAGPTNQMQARETGNCAACHVTPPSWVISRLADVSSSPHPALHPTVGETKPVH